jgi:sugar/nucleoside kinase (ribokinase family)
MQSKAAMTRVLVIGEINVDLILGGCEKFPSYGTEVLAKDGFLTLGSASAITAVGLARLGTPVSFLGKVGVDPNGAVCLNAMESAGVDITRVERNKNVQTGITVSIVGSDDRALVTFPGSIAALKGGDVSDQLLEQFGHLHVSSYFLQSNLTPALPNIFKRAQTLGLTVSVDPGFDPAEEWDTGLLEALVYVDLFFPNEIELSGLTGMLTPGEAVRTLDNGRTIVVAKLGRSGCLVRNDGVSIAEPAIEVSPVDSTGAGDSFNAGFLNAWLEGEPVRECMRSGNICGGLATRRAGGTPGQPDRSELNAALKAKK